MVQAASVSIHGPHGQYVENIHLLPYATEEEFWSEHYEKQYAKLIAKASDFLESTSTGEQADTLVFVRYVPPTLIPLIAAAHARFLKLRF